MTTQQQRLKDARRSPTVRHREVLSRVGEVFDLDALQASACHRYAGHTRRMAAEMVARGAIETVGDGRYRKTERAVPACVREGVEPGGARGKGGKGGKGGKARGAGAKGGGGKASGAKASGAGSKAGGAGSKANGAKSNGAGSKASSGRSKANDGSAPTRDRAPTADMRGEPGKRGGKPSPTTTTTADDTRRPIRVRRRPPEPTPPPPPAGFTPEPGDRLITAQVFNRFDVTQVHPDGRITVVDRHGHHHGSWSVTSDSPRAWFRPRRGDAGERLEPLNPTAREVTADGTARLAAHWFDASAWHTLLDADGRRLMITIAEAGTLTRRALMRRLGARSDAIAETLQKLDDLRLFQRMPLPYRAHTADGEETWTWDPERHKAPREPEPARVPAPAWPARPEPGGEPVVSPSGRVRLSLRALDGHTRHVVERKTGRRWETVAAEATYDRAALAWLDAEDRIVNANHYTAEAARWQSSSALVPLDAIAGHLDLSQPGIHALLADGTARTLAVEHNTRLDDGERARLLERLADGGPWTIVAVRPGRGRPRDVERIVADQLFAEARRRGVHLGRVVLYTRALHLLAESEHAPRDTAPARHPAGAIDVGEPPAAVPDARRLAWMIRRAAEALDRPTRGVWVVCGRQVHPIGALPEDIDVMQPAVFVDVTGAGEVEAVAEDAGFLLAVEPVRDAIRRFRLPLTEDQREGLLDAIRVARGERGSVRDATGIWRRLDEGFRRERVFGGQELWVDARNSMSWVTRKGARNAEVVEAFFVEMARRLTEGLADDVRAKAEKVLARAFRMARRQGGRRPKMERGGKGPSRRGSAGGKPSEGKASTAKPSTSTDKASTGTGKASTGKPSTGTDKPSTSASKPSTGTGKPSTDTGKPSAAPAPTADEAPAATAIPGFDLIEGRHTRLGHAIWTVRVTERVPRDRFAVLRAIARAVADPDSAVATGYYSSYHKQGAIPGFIFASAAEAHRFIARAAESPPTPGDGSGEVETGRSWADQSIAKKSRRMSRAEAAQEVHTFARRQLARPRLDDSQRALYGAIRDRAAEVLASEPAPPATPADTQAAPVPDVDAITRGMTTGPERVAPVPPHAHPLQTISELTRAPRFTLVSPDGPRWQLTRTDDTDPQRGRRFTDQAGQTWFAPQIATLVNRAGYAAFVANTVDLATRRPTATSAAPSAPTPRPTPADPPPLTAPWPIEPDKPAARTAANLRAVQLAFTARRTGAAPTAEQRDAMLQYSGWGGLSIDKVRADWPEGIPLPNKRALVHEYYTPWTVCADITRAVQQLLPGRDPIRALEPSAGIGRFIHTTDPARWQWTAVELSPLSALILDQTTRAAAVDVTEGSFEAWVQANGARRFDAVVSNPPYGPRGEHKVEDKDRRFRVAAAYPYFILRGMSLLAPGGIGAFLVPGGFLTGASNRRLRARLDPDADLVAAFRLPSGIFPGARLSLDVVLLRARAEAKSSLDRVFVDGIYFDEHPQHVLGELKPSGRWGEPEVIGDYPGLPDFAPRQLAPDAIAAPDATSEAEPITLAPGFTALEMDDGKPARARRPKPGTLPAGLRAVEMERRVQPDLAAALERAKFFTDPDHPQLRGVRVGDGLVIASDGRRLIELAVDDHEPPRLLDLAGDPMPGDYPDPATLLPTSDPLATVDPAPLAALYQRLKSHRTTPVPLTIDGPHLRLADEAMPGATIAPGAADGTWLLSLPALRTALAGATTGRLLLPAAGAAVTIERDDGERHLLLPVAAPDCNTCPLPALPDAPPPAHPQGPQEGELAALLARRLAAYEAADPADRLLLHPELAAALDAFAATFGRRLGAPTAPTATATQARDEATARRLLAAHPAGVPVARVADPRRLLDRGWCLDADRLLPRADYLSGNLWTRLDRLEAIPSPFADVIPAQRAALDEAIGDVDYPTIADRVGLRDGWLPLRVLGAFLGSLRRNDPRPIALERREGIVQFREGSVDYDDITDRFDTASPIRLIIGYINHDEQVFKPRKPKDEDINKVRRAKADDFEQRFKAFLSTRPALRDLVVEGYRRAHRGFRPRTYSGAPLTLARWGEAIHPHPHQNAGARRAVDQRGMVAAYGVGVGKTFTACATIALARQNQGTRRPVILVPNSLVAKWQRDIHKALPDYAVVTIGEKASPGRDGTLRYGPDTQADREVKWRRFAAGLYDIALVTPSAFLRTRITPDEFERLAAGATELQRSVRLAQRNARSRSNPSERQQAVLEQGVRAFLAEMMELPPTWERDDIRWSELGVDLLVVDEAQNYKGLHSPENREGGVPRFMGQSAASKRAWNLDARARDVRARHGFVVLLSATPAKNSPLELYNLWSYVNGELWRDHGIHDPEAFISRFLTIEHRLVINATLEADERPAVTGFKHLDELKAILLRWGEFIQPPDIGLEVPEPTTELVEVEMDAAQEDKYEGYVTRIEAELDAMRRGEKSNRILGLLARMGLVAVHAELDGGHDYKSAAGHDPSSPKFEAIADYILTQRTCGHIIFVQAIAAHRWLKETLVNRGIPARRIGILNGTLTKSSDARQRVADDFNAGRLDVVIANSIAYEGLDLQTRTCAIHHADLPWEPATLNQRNGRAVRQGNTLSTVAIRYYFSKRSMDGLRFNLIQGKQGWMGALLEGSDAIANPGADLELGPDEVLLLISRTPEETRRRLDALRAQAEAKRRADEAERAVKLLESGAGQLIEARDAQTPERAERLRAGADAALDAVARIDPAIWPWAELLAAARAAGADELLARPGTPPLYPGAWLRVDGRWHEVGRFGWQGTHRTVALREPGAAGWTTRKVAEVTAGATPADVAAARPPAVIDDWQPAAARLVEHTLGNPYRGWPSMGWSSAAPAWLEAAWPAVEDIATTQINGVPATYYHGGHGPAETRFPCDLDGAVYLHQTGGPLPAGARLLPPTADGWRRWLALAVGDDYKLALRDEASRWWWGRPLRPGMQRTRKNPSRPTSRWSARRVADVGSSSSHAGEAMQLPPLTPIGSYLVLGVDHGSRLAWLEHTRTARDAQRAQQDVPADIPLVVIVRVENNALAASRRPAHLAGGDPVFVQPGRLIQDAGLVIAADGRDAISAVVHAKDLDAAYTANDRRVPPGVPRTLIGTVRHRYRSAA